jgi:hypothetical protein
MADGQHSDYRRARHCQKLCVRRPGHATLRPGKRNLEDPRLDQAHQLVEAKKKMRPARPPGEDDLVDAEAVLVPVDRRVDLILKDLELIETRLGRTPPDLEKPGSSSSRPRSNPNNSCPKWP